MTSMVTELITSGLPSTPSLALALPVDAMVTALLIVLLAARLLVTASSGLGGRPTLQVLDVAAIPLFLAFAVVVLDRVMEILPLG